MLMLTLACPYKGKAIPFAFITYSEATLSQEETSIGALAIIWTS
jgi:hypothetical protein